MSIFVLPPEGEIHMPCNVMHVHTNIFSKVSYTLFLVLLGTSEVHHEFTWGISHLCSVSLLDDFTVCEQVRSNLIEWRKNNAMSKIRVNDSSVKGINKLSFIHALSPVGCVVNSTVPCLALHQNIKKHKSFLSLAFIEKREPMMLLQKSVVFQFLNKMVYSFTSILVHRGVGLGIKTFSIPFQVIKV